MGSSLGQRIRWILATRGIGQRELSRRAMLDEVHVSKILSRERRNRNASVDARTVAALAEGANVSLRWLSSGDGPPDAPDSTPTHGAGLSGLHDGQFVALTPAIREAMGREAVAEGPPEPLDFAIAQRAMVEYFAHLRFPDARIDELVGAVLDSRVVEVATRIRAGHGRRGELALALAGLVLAHGAQVHRLLGSATPSGHADEPPGSS